MWRPVLEIPLWGDVFIWMETGMSTMGGKEQRGYRVRKERARQERAQEWSVGAVLAEEIEQEETSESVSKTKDRKSF